MNPHALIKMFNYNAEVVHEQLHDVSHEESLVQPIKNSHSINWLLGHLVSARTLPLKYVHAEPVWTEEQRARYRGGSAPIGADEPLVIKLPALLTLFDLTHERLTAGIATLTDDMLNSPSGFKENTFFESFNYFQFHETYHIGQMTIIAEFLGKPSRYLKS
ncbi:MAG: DinB family protein [bacterium]|nr:DinB family protein [bacterium]